jgi:transcriptional regulator with XRE-family HTH domain
MKWHEKLSLFFKEKKISQKEVANMMGISRPMMSRYLNGHDNVSQDFIISLLREFPEIDLRLIFSDNDDTSIRSVVNEDLDNNKELDIVAELTQIEKKIALIKQKLAQ